MEKRILLLADIASSHTEKWVMALASKGFKVGIFSLNQTKNNWYKDKKNVLVFRESQQFRNANFVLNKFRYIVLLPRLISVLKHFKPHILHAHYATSYGLLGALSNYKPFVISAWGSDVFEFPRKSPLHKYVLRFNLKRADKILATSEALKGELGNYTNKPVEIIPFGIDTDLFYPHDVKSKSEKNVTYIGTIKSLEDIYGITSIIEAIKIVRQKMPTEKIKLFLVGGGSRTNFYKSMVAQLGLTEYVVFPGKIAFDKIPYFHNLLDIFLNVSIVDESFGVAALEALACEKPIIVTDAPGLLEIIGRNTGVAEVIEKNNPLQLSQVIIKLILSPDLRSKMGKQGRQHVETNYDFKNCIAKQLRVYNAMISGDEKLVFNKI